MSLIIPAYNEEAALPLRICNLAPLITPQKSWKLSLFPMAPPMPTNSILSGLPGQNHRIIVLPARGGKSNAMNHGVKGSRFEILSVL